MFFNVCLNVFSSMYLKTLREKKPRTEKHWEKTPPMKISNNVNANLSGAPCRNGKSVIYKLGRADKVNYRIASPLKREFCILIVISWLNKQTMLLHCQN